VFHQELNFLPLMAISKVLVGVPMTIVACAGRIECKDRTLRSKSHMKFLAAILSLVCTHSYAQLSTKAHALELHSSSNSVVIRWICERQKDDSVNLKMWGQLKNSDSDPLKNSAVELMLSETFDCDQSVSVASDEGTQISILDARMNPRGVEYLLSVNRDSGELGLIGKLPVSAVKYGTGFLNSDSSKGSIFLTTYAFRENKLIIDQVFEYMIDGSVCVDKKTVVKSDQCHFVTKKASSEKPICIQHLQASKSQIVGGDKCLPLLNAVKN
jgi:hypothetical protein